MLLRPDAVRERILYVLVANVAIGTLAAGLLLRHLIRRGALTARHAGFSTMRTSVGAVLTGGALGFGLYVVQGPSTLEPVVLANGFAQALAVSIAEVLVCWSIVGATLESALGARLGRWRTPAAALAAAVLFGVYHYAHSPPFNTLGVVTLLTVVGLVTGAFFFVSRDVYGTIVFHNFLALFGVLRALDEAGHLEAYTVLQPALVASATAGIVVLVAIHARFMRVPATSATQLNDAC